MVYIKVAHMYLVYMYLIRNTYLSKLFKNFSFSVFPPTISMVCVPCDLTMLPRSSFKRATCLSNALQWTI